VTPYPSFAEIIVSVLARYEDMKGGAKCRKCGGLGQSGVTQGDWK